MSELEIGCVRALPVIHGRLACAQEARRLLHSERFTDVVVELPASLRELVLEGLAMLPRITAVVYRHDSDFEERLATRWYVPIDPCDAMIEALRSAEELGVPAYFADRDVSDEDAVAAHLPDAYALRTLGAEAWWESLQPWLAQHPRLPLDAARELHMVAVLQRVVRERGPGARVLFLCGLAHWSRVRGLLAQSGTFDEEPGERPEHAELLVLARASLGHALSEFPWMAARWERQRLRKPDFDQAAQVPQLLQAARDEFERRHGDTLEHPTPPRLATLVSFARKLTLRGGRLLPDAWTLGIAARGCVGNDYALALLSTLQAYRANPAQGLMLGRDTASVGDERWPMRLRTSGEARELKVVKLHRPPPPRLQHRWRRAWDPTQACSWLPEDQVIESFRRRVCGSALQLAGLERRRTQPFTTSMLDGLDLRATLRDPHLRLHVREEPRTPGGVGAFVMIFEDDPTGMRFPFRSTWYAEKPWESTLCFYATHPLDLPVGPGVAQAQYGGAFFLYPPLPIPDIWDDLTFEQSRTSAERLVRAAIFWAQDRFIIHVAERPPSRELEREAAMHGRHLVHLPLSTFPQPQLQRLRRMHVLNGTQVRSWAGRWIR